MDQTKETDGRALTFWGRTLLTSLSAAALVLGITACANPGEATLATVVQVGQDGAAVAPVLSGELNAQVVDGKAYFVVENEGPRFGLLLPEGFAAKFDGDKVTMLDAEGGVVAAEGDRIAAGGSTWDEDSAVWEGGPDVDAIWLAEPGTLHVDE